jgi:phage shock protein PspC (stress-responsive transcriptional regulator)
MDVGTPPLRRSREKRVLAGVMGGIAEHFDLNVTLLRLLYVIVSIASAAFPGILVYLLLWLLIPARRPGDAAPARA